jgi:hypothetical protein
MPGLVPGIYVPREPIDTSNPRGAFDHLGSGVLALLIEQLVDRLTNDRDHHAAFLGQRCDVRDREPTSVESALLALVAASLGGKPCPPARHANVAIR